MESEETQERFLGMVQQGDLCKISLTPIPDNEFRREWLPQPGFVVKPQPTSNLEVVNETRERQRAIIHCSLYPPEAKEQSKIGAVHLSQAVKLFQRVVTYAYRKAMQDLDLDTRKAIGNPDNCNLEIFSFTPGSFTLHMQTVSLCDLFGYSPVAKAFNIIDFITAHIDSPEKAVQSVSGYGGHFAAAYRDLLQFIVENEIPMSYEWSMPERNNTTTRKITDKQAKPVYEELIKRLDLNVEYKVIKGKVTKIDEDYGSWRLFSEIDNTEYSGRSDVKQILLKGIVIDGLYEFTCEEHLEEERGTGRDRTILYLKSFHSMV